MDDSLLVIEAEIISLEPKGFIIKVSNSETKEVFEAKSVREYAEFLINSVNNSKCYNYTVKWKPSPKARRRDIDLIGMQLGMMQQWMDEELKIEGEDLDDGDLKKAIKES